MDDRTPPGDTDLLATDATEDIHGPQEGDQEPHPYDLEGWVPDPLTGVRVALQATMATDESWYAETGAGIVINWPAVAKVVVKALGLEVGGFEVLDQVTRSLVPEGDLAEWIETETDDLSPETFMASGDGDLRIRPLWLITQGAWEPPRPDPNSIVGLGLVEVTLPDGSTAMVPEDVLQ